MAEEHLVLIEKARRRRRRAWIFAAALLVVSVAATLGGCHYLRHRYDDAPLKELLGPGLYNAEAPLEIQLSSYHGDPADELVEAVGKAFRPSYRVVDQRVFSSKVQRPEENGELVHRLWMRMTEDCDYTPAHVTVASDSNINIIMYQPPSGESRLIVYASLPAKPKPEYWQGDAVWGYFDLRKNL